MLHSDMVSLLYISEPNSFRRCLVFCFDCHIWFGNSWVKASGVWITSSLYTFLVCERSNIRYLRSEGSYIITDGWILVILGLLSQLKFYCYTPFNFHFSTWITLLDWIEIEDSSKTIFYLERCQLKMFQRRRIFATTAQKSFQSISYWKGIFDQFITKRSIFV